MIKAILPQRTQDAYGSGAFGAPRGDHMHNGIDYVCDMGTKILAPASGEVSKVGYCYKDDLSFRYVEITDEEGFRHRVFYVSPDCAVGNIVIAGQSCIGIAQDLTKRYPRKTLGGLPITNHVHYEIKKGTTFYDPSDFA